jgi:hypothetical protein
MERRKTAAVDFDSWMRTAQEDPEAFEAMRLAAIEDVINRAREANRERLRRLQWRIDQERRLAKTPLSACIRLSRMMWRNVTGPGGLQERFAELQRTIAGSNTQAEHMLPRPRAEVVPLVRIGD